MVENVKKVGFFKPLVWAVSLSVFAFSSTVFAGSSFGLGAMRKIAGDAVSGYRNSSGSISNRAVDSLIEVSTPGTTGRTREAQRNAVKYMLSLNPEKKNEYYNNMKNEIVGASSRSTGGAYSGSSHNTSNNRKNAEPLTPTQEMKAKFSAKRNLYKSKDFKLELSDKLTKLDYINILPAIEWIAARFPYRVPTNCASLMVSSESATKYKLELFEIRGKGCGGGPAHYTTMGFFTYDTMHGELSVMHWGGEDVKLAKFY